MNAHTRWEPVIGLEVHVELATTSKMFCACPNAPFELPANAATCPTCLGLPGALPVANRRAVGLGIRAALALGCDVAETCGFERKSYAYPDLVKGYQLTQYERPVGRHGRVLIHPDDRGEMAVAIRRAHLEEDTAKLLHRADAEGRECSFLDANRSGVPLLEIVTEPTLRSAEDVDLCLRKLRAILIHNGIAHCRMERGEMRLEANVSLRPAGSDEMGPRVEIKNQSSFRFVRDAIRYEIRRQGKILAAGGTVHQATRGYNPDTRRTFEQRTKEDENDYRYFPDPDLPAVRIDRAWVEEVRAGMPPDLDALRRTLVDRGVREEQIQTLLTEGESEFLLAIDRRDPEGVQGAVKWMLRELPALRKEHARSLSDSLLEPGEMVAVLRLVRERKLGAPAAVKVLDTLFVEGGQAEEVIARHDLALVDDPSGVVRAVEDVLSERADLVAQYRSGKTKVRQALFGAVMRKLGGRASPPSIAQELGSRLDAERDEDS